MLLRLVLGVCVATVLGCGPAPAVRDPGLLEVGDPELSAVGDWFCGDSYGWGCVRNRAACGPDCVAFDTVWCFKVSSGQRCYPDSGECLQQQRDARGVVSSCRRRP
ncbi:MAG TPA: hypothetical protein VHW23_41190 [Kofleriaceae bacterium]|jgi:hypothetical protein|nr:hypothetical protein [Kofleriaceae bacterium]